MANQPPSRPWFRLPNLARQQPPPPPPAPAPEVPAPQQPRMPVIRPAFRPAFAQSQAAPPPPPPPPQSAPGTATASPTGTQPPSPAAPTPLRIASPSPPPTPPPRPVVSVPPPKQPPPPPPPAPLEASPTPPRRSTQLPTPTASPQSSIKTTRSPPPITLPPPQFTSSKASSQPRNLPEAEQEKVLLQDTFNRKMAPPASDQGNSVKGVNHKVLSKYGRVKEPDSRKSSSSDSEEGKSVRIITMAGENKGALMELGFPSRKNEGKLFPGSGRKVGNEFKESEALNDGNADRSKMKDSDKETETASRLPMNGYVNSNVQGINNSILHNCSFTDHDPGVHFSLSRKKPSIGKAQGHGSANGKNL